PSWVSSLSATARRRPIGTRTSSAAPDPTMNTPIWSATDASSAAASAARPAPAANEIMKKRNGVTSSRNARTTAAPNQIHSQSLDSTKSTVHLAHSVQSRGSRSCDNGEVDVPARLRAYYEPGAPTRELADRLVAAGHACYLVGGTVRDAFPGRESPALPLTPPPPPGWR